MKKKTNQLTKCLVRVPYPKTNLLLEKETLKAVKTCASLYLIVETAHTKMVCIIDWYYVKIRLHFKNVKYKFVKYNSIFS